MIKHIVSVAALALCAMPAPVSASQRGSDQIIVDVRDLDLSLSADRARADRRITAAIRSLCATPGHRSIEARNAEADCRDQARASVRPLGF